MLFPGGTRETVKSVSCRYHMRFTSASEAKDSFLSSYLPRSAAPRDPIDPEPADRESRRRPGRRRAVARRWYGTRNWSLTSNTSSRRRSSLRLLAPPRAHAAHLRPMHGTHARTRTSRTCTSTQVNPAWPTSGITSPTDRGGARDR